MPVQCLYSSTGALSNVVVGVSKYVACARKVLIFAVVIPSCPHIRSLDTGRQMVAGTKSGTEN